MHEGDQQIFDNEVFQLEKIEYRFTVYLFLAEMEDGKDTFMKYLATTLSFAMSIIRQCRRQMPIIIWETPIQKMSSYRQFKGISYISN